MNKFLYGAVPENPLKAIVNEVQKRIEGQELSIKFLTVMKAMAHLENCKGTSGNVLLRSESGAGKDSIVHEILRPWGFEKHNRIQKLTKEAISYSDNEDFTYDGRSLHLEEVTSKTINNPTMLTFLSNNYGETLTMKSVKDNESQDSGIKGKPIVLMTSSTLDLDYDNLRRVRVWFMDVSNEQKRAVIRKRQKVRRMKSQDSEDNNLYMYLQGIQAKSFRVNIPYDTELTEAFINSFPEDVPTSAMTIIDFIFDFVSAVTILNFVNRKEVDGALISTEEDWNIAQPILDELFKEGLLPVMPKEKDIIEVMGGGSAPICEHCDKGEGCGNPTVYTLKEIRAMIPYEPDWKTVQVRMNTLIAKGIISKVDRDSRRCGYQRKVTSYKINEFARFKSMELRITNSNDGSDGKDTNDGNDATDEENQKEGTSHHFHQWSKNFSYSKIEDHLNSLKDKEFDKTDFNNFLEEGLLTNKELNDLFETWSDKGLIYEAKAGSFRLL